MSRDSFLADKLGIAENTLLIVKLGGLEPLIHLMLSPNIEAQCNAVGCHQSRYTWYAF